MRETFGRSYYIAPWLHKNPKRNSKRLREVLPYKNRGRLLSVGCGQDAFLELARENFWVEGLDISSYVVDSFREKSGIRVTLGDIERVRLARNRYDVVALFNVLEHLGDPVRTILKIYNSLVPGGIAVGSVPHNFGIVGRTATKLASLADQTHCSTYPLAKWQSHFREIGFQEVALFGEIHLGEGCTIYLKNGFWKHISFNTMFIYQK